MVANLSPEFGHCVITTGYYVMSVAAVSEYGMWQPKSLDCIQCIHRTLCAHYGSRQEVNLVLVLVL